MKNNIITLITTLLVVTVSAQIPAHPECRIRQWEYDESGAGSSYVMFSRAKLNNQSPGDPGSTKWDYLTGFTVYGNTANAYTSKLNFDIDTGGDPNTVVKGQVYGVTTTISNFTFSTGENLVVPKSGYYTFNIAATEGAILNIRQAGDYYCCESPMEVKLEFYVADLESEPEHNQLENSIYLLAGFRYSFAMIYLNSNGASPSLKITMTDPDGVLYDDIDPFIVRTTGISPDYCSYENVTTTTIIEWESSTTATSVNYVTSTNAAGSKVIESQYIVQVPSSTPVPSSSSSELESSSTVDVVSSSTVDEVSSSTVDVVSSSTDISSTEVVNSSTLESSSQITSDASSSTIVTSSTVFSEPESSTISSSEFEHSSTLMSSEESTSAISSESSSFSESELISSVTSFASISTAEPTESPSEILSSTLIESSSLSNEGSQSDTFTTISSISTTTSSGDVTSNESSESFTGNTETGFSEATTTTDSLSHEDENSGNGNNGWQTTQYVTETSVIRTTITSLCSTSILQPDVSISSLEVLTSTYVTEYTTTMVVTICPGDKCQPSNFPTATETTVLNEVCTKDCDLTTVGLRSSNANKITTTRNSESTSDSEEPSLQKPYIQISSSETISGFSTSHTVIQNVNIGFHKTYDGLMFTISMIMSLLL